jgi:hypothetical protein
MKTRTFLISTLLQRGEWGGSAIQEPFQRFSEFARETVETVLTVVFSANTRLKPGANETRPQVPV